MKLQIGLDQDGCLSAFVQITEGKVDEVNLARRLDLQGGSIVVFDRGYTDYAWYNQLNSSGIYFVTPQKKNACYTVIERRSVSRTSGITCRIRRSA